MPLNNAALDLMANALRSGATYLALHSADPSTTGANPTSAARVAATWTTASNGDFSLSASKAFTGGAASGAVTYVGLWSASTGGTFYGGFALTGDTTFNSAGEYTLTALAINGSAS